MLVLMPRELDEAKKIQLLLDDLRTKSYSVRVLHRNQRFAHIDYAVAKFCKGSVQVFMLLAQETKYESFNKIYNTQKFSKTDKYADNPAQLDTAYIRSSTLIEILF